MHNSFISSLNSKYVYASQKSLKSQTFCLCAVWVLFWRFRTQYDKPVMSTVILDNRLYLHKCSITSISSPTWSYLFTNFLYFQEKNIIPIIIMSVTVTAVSVLTTLVSFFKVKEWGNVVRSHWAYKLTLWWLWSHLYATKFIRNYS